MIRSTFSGFNTAQLAMAASQKSLDVVGQNIANVNTPSYTRQRLDLQSLSPAGLSQWNSSNSNKVGQGVMMTGVSQIRDPYLDIQYRDQLADVGTSDAMNTILDSIGNVFDESSRESIRNALNNVVSQLENMSNAGNAGQDGSDKLVRSAMEVLLNIFHENASSLQNIQMEQVSKLTGTEKQKIQSYLDSIAEINGAIKSSQVLGDPALELMDQRNTMIDELATYLPIDVSYSPQSVGAGVNVDILKITFLDANGQSHTLINDTEKADFQIESANGDGMPPLKISILSPDAPAGNTPEDVTYVLKEGVLKGNVDMLNKKGIYDKTDSDVKGIGYYEDYFDGFVNAFATRLNELNGAENPLFETSDNSTTFTASNIRISDKWASGETAIQTTTEKVDGATDNSSGNDNVLKMINALTTESWIIQTPDKETVFEGTAFDCYDNLQNTQAIEQQSVSSILDNRITVLNQIADSKDSVSGVYLDEEVMNLMKYQQSYNAAARLMTTLDEALNTLINNTGVVGR